MVGCENFDSDIADPKSRNGTSIYEFEFELEHIGVTLCPELNSTGEETL